MEALEQIVKTSDMNNKKKNGKDDHSITDPHQPQNGKQNGSGLTIRNLSMSYRSNGFSREVWWGDIDYDVPPQCACKPVTEMYKNGGLRTKSLMKTNGCVKAPVGVRAAGIVEKEWWNKEDDEADHSLWVNVFNKAMSSLIDNVYDEKGRLLLCNGIYLYVIVMSLI